MFKFSGAHALMASAAAMAGAFSFAAPAQAADPLTWSFAFGHVERCPFNASGTCGPTAGTLQDLGQQAVYGPNQDSSVIYGPASYAAVKPFDYGTASASANAGTLGPGAPIALPELHAETTGKIVNADLGFSWNFSSAQGVQGFRNTTDTALVLDIGTFVGIADFASTAPAGNGFVSASLAILTSAVEDDAVGNAWYQYSNAPGQFGQFAADCSTAGAIALSNGPAVFSAASPGSLSVAPTACSAGATTFTVNPGDSFYLWARLSTFRAADGTTDASNTFKIQFASTVSADTQQFLAASLEQVPGIEVSTGVPEPAEWALMLSGFAGLGLALRRRRRLAVA